MRNFCITLIFLKIFLILCESKSFSVIKDTRPIKIFGTGSSEGLKYSPDGRRLFIATSNFVRLVDVKTSESIRVFIGHENDILSMTFSADARKMLTSSEDGTVKLWNTIDGREMRTLIGYPDTYKNNTITAAISPDGKKAISSSRTSTVYEEVVILWDLNTGEKIHIFNNLGYYSDKMAFSRDSRRILITVGQSAKLFDAETFQLIRTFSGHTDIIYCCEFSPDGLKLLTGSGDKNAILWNVSTGGIIHTFKGHTSYISSVAFFADGRRILTGSGDYSAKIWDANTGKEVKTFKGHTYSVYSTAPSPDGLTIATGSGDKTVRRWDVNTGKEIGCWEDCSSSIAISPDGKYVLTGKNNEAILWNIETEQKQKTFRGHSGSVYAVAFSPDGSLILTGGGSSVDKLVKLWDANTGKLIRTLTGHTGGISSVDFCPTGTLALSSSFDKTAKIWDYESGQELITLQHSSSVYCAVFSPSGNQVLTGSYGTAKLWDVKTGEVIQTYAGHESYVYSVAFSPDNTKVLTGTSDVVSGYPPSGIGIARLWDTNSGSMIKMYYLGTDTIYSVAYSPNGKQILVSGWRGQPIWDDNSNAYLYDIATALHIKYFFGHSNSVSQAIFSADGSKVLTGSGDGTVRLWNVQSPPTTPTPTPVPMRDEIVGHILQRSEFMNGDVNHDGRIDIADVLLVISLGYY